eukprot:Gb_39682 [translate_table: standard]
MLLLMPQHMTARMVDHSSLDLPLRAMPLNQNVVFNCGGAHNIAVLEDSSSMKPPLWSMGLLTEMPRLLKQNMLFNCGIAHNIAVLEDYLSMKPPLWSMGLLTEMPRVLQLPPSFPMEKLQSSFCPSENLVVNRKKGHSAMIPKISSCETGVSSSCSGWEVELFDCEVVKISPVASMQTRNMVMKLNFFYNSSALEQYSYIPGQRVVQHLLFYSCLTITYRKTNGKVSFSHALPQGVQNVLHAYNMEDLGKVISTTTWFSLEARMSKMKLPRKIQVWNEFIVSCAIFKDIVLRRFELANHDRPTQTDMTFLLKMNFITSCAIDLAINVTFKMIWMVNGKEKKKTSLLRKHTCGRVQRGGQGGHLLWLKKIPIQCADRISTEVCIG